MLGFDQEVQNLYHNIDENYFFKRNFDLFSFKCDPFFLQTELNQFY